jgi:hypothetical protein
MALFLVIVNIKGSYIVDVLFRLRQAAKLRDNAVISDSEFCMFYYLLDFAQTILKG